MINYVDDRLVFIDTETGGTDPLKHSLLSIGVVVWDKTNGIIAQKEFFVKSTKYYVTKEAQRINKFDIELHNKVAKDPKEVINGLIAFLKDFFPENMGFPVVGHNIQFDINFLKVFFKTNGRSFNKYFAHRSIDTYSIYKAMSMAGLIDKNLNSSSDAFAFFNIRVQQRHSALSDCIATVELFEKLLSLLEKHKLEQYCCQ